ncbi:MAG: Cys-tRNA(Pro) deacylase [Fusobacteriaceae bacterium]
MKKTNAVRELEAAKLHFNLVEYIVDDEDVSAINVALKLGLDITKLFKTLILFSEKKELLVVCIPGSDELDLKKFAKIAEVKKVEMLEVKELLEHTGYVRGGCSPLGIKKKHRTFIHSSVLKKEKIYLSAGCKGLQIEMNSMELIKYAKIQVVDVIK